MKTKQITGKFDHVFLSLVTFDNNYLKEIIYEVLNIRFNEAEIINSKLAKNKIMNRANSLDLIVKTEIGYINIEVNTDYNSYIAHRNFVYLNNLVTNVTKSGDKLKDMPTTIQINLIFGQTPKKINTSKYNIYSKDENKILTKKFEIYNVYVDKLKNMYYNDNIKLTYKPALMALAMTKDELEERKDENMFYEKLYAKLDEMADKDEGIAPELMSIEEEKEWYRQALIWGARDEGIEQGIEQKQSDIIKNMLNEKMDINLIMKITGASSEYINEIAGR